MVNAPLKLYGGALQATEQALTALLGKSRARYVLVIDRRGFVLLHQRAPWAPPPPSLDALASLVASNYSATAALAKLFGETRFQELMQQGAQVGTYLEEIGSQALLVTVFDPRTPLGRIKHLSKGAVTEILAAQRLEDGAPPELPFSALLSAAQGPLLEAFETPLSAERSNPLSPTGALSADHTGPERSKPGLPKGGA